MTKANKLQEETKLETLSDVRFAIREADKLRFRPNVQEVDIALLENAIHALKDVERDLIKVDEEKLINSIKRASESLKEYSSHIRSVINRVNHGTKVLDTIDGIIKRFNQVLNEINVWSKWTPR